MQCALNLRNKLLDIDKLNGSILGILTVQRGRNIRPDIAVDFVARFAIKLANNVSWSYRGFENDMIDQPSRRRWTRSELIRAFNLYCQTPFGKIHNRNPAIIGLAISLDRTPSAVSWKLANFARLDPTLAERNIKGASHGSKEEELIWKEFESNWELLAFESEQLRLGKDGIAAIAATQDFPEGRNRESLVRVRVNQDFFRRAVLNAYSSACCITGIKIPELLCASHIVPWSVDMKNRTNPSNGLCLNALHDRAFDRGLITINSEFRVVVSSKVKKLMDSNLNAMLGDFNGRQIIMPRHFVPRREFIEHHNANIFRG